MIKSYVYSNNLAGKAALWFTKHDDVAILWSVGITTLQFVNQICRCSPQDRVVLRICSVALGHRGQMFWAPNSQGFTVAIKTTCIFAWQYKAAQYKP